MIIPTFFEYIPKMNVLKKYINHYDYMPSIEVDVIVQDRSLVLKGLIDTGSTYTIIAKEKAEYLLGDAKSSIAEREIEVNGGGGSFAIHLLEKLGKIRIPNYHQTDEYLELDLYYEKSGAIKHNKDSGVNFDIILGLSFLSTCQSFWINANAKTLQLEFF